MTRKFIPVNEPLLGKSEKKYLLECINKNEVSSSGNFVKEFEKKFAKKVKRKYAVSVSNGTAAIQLAFESLNLKKGDEVILPSFTIISCILPIIRLGAKPILVDCDPRTWNMDVDKAIKLINKKTKAIILVNIYGLCVDMDKIISICKKKRIKILEDSAESLGLDYKGKPCGSFGDVSTFSFFANKHITTGEGGMIVTNNKNIYQKCLLLRNIYFNNQRRFKHFGLGWNYRLTNLQSAIGLSQLKKLEKFIKTKRKIGNKYLKKFSKLKSIYNPVQKLSYCENVYWVYGIVLKKKSKYNVENLRKKLLKKGIETRNFFWPLNKQPILNKMGYFKNQKFPVSENLSKRGFYIPTGLALKKKDQDYVIKTICELIN